MDIGGVVNLVTICVLVGFASLGFVWHVRGNSKGLFCVLLDLAFVIINLIASIFVSGIITDLLISPNTIYSVLDMLNGGATEGTMAELLSQMELYLRDGEFLATADFSLVFAIFETVLNPIVFILTFFALGIILFIVKQFIKIAIPRTKGIVLRLTSGGVGAIKDVLIIAIYLAPLIGFATYGINTVHKAADTIGGNDLTSIETEVVKYESVVTGGALGVISSCGGQFLFETLSTTNVNDVEVSLVDETDNILNIYASVLPLLEINTIEFTANEADLLDRAIDEIEKSEYLTATVSSIIAQCTDELYKSDMLFDFKRPYLGESFDPVVEKMLEIWSKTNSEALVRDLRTCSAIFRSLIDNGLFKVLNTVDGDLLSILENSKFYEGILLNLHYNNRTRPIVPSLANALQQYLYEVYEAINGYPYALGGANAVDVNKIDESSLSAESVRIATAVRELNKFANSTTGVTYVDEIVKVGDFVALGTGLNQMRDSIFFGGSYEFLLDSILHSEACAKLGIFDNNFVENAVGNPDDPSDDADMVQLLVSRQNLTKLTMAMWDGDTKEQEDSLKILISNLAFDPDDPFSRQNAENEIRALKELAALDNLTRYGVGGDKGNTVSTITESLVDTIHDHRYVDKNGDGVVDQTDIDMEAAATAHVITVLSGVHNNIEGATTIFGAQDSVTGESAAQFVSEILDSSIANEMIDDALDGGKNDDPYGIHATLTDADKENVESALMAEYKNGTNRVKLKNIAAVLGVTFNP